MADYFIMEVVLLLIVVYHKGVFVYTFLSNTCRCSAFSRFQVGKQRDTKEDRQQQTMDAFEAVCVSRRDQKHRTKRKENREANI